MAYDPLKQKRLCSMCNHMRHAKFVVGETRNICIAFNMIIETEAITCTDFWARGRDKFLEDVVDATKDIKIIKPDKVDIGGYI